MDAMTLREMCDSLGVSRRAVQGYEKTSYTIASLEITFKERADITEDEKEAFYLDLQEEFSANDDEMKQVKRESISMYTESKIVCNAGENVASVQCFYYRGYFSVKNIDHYKLVEPDIATMEHGMEIVFENEKYKAVGSQDIIL